MEFSVFYLSINNVEPTFYMQLTASNIGIMCTLNETLDT